MKIYLGADHRGFALKEEIKAWLSQSNYSVEDLGAISYDVNDDYVDFAKEVAEKVSAEESNRGILICGSGHGVDIAANRFAGIRSIVGFNNEVVVQGREHEDANILSLPSDWVQNSEAKERAQLFLETPFSGQERHLRRLEKLHQLSR